MIKSLLQKNYLSTINHLRKQSTMTQANLQMFELREYKIQPKYMSKFQTLTNEHLHLRLKHSPLQGYWQYELGGLNTVFHIWKYDSITHRANIRKALSQDADWIKSYLSPAMEYLVEQNNAVCTLHELSYEGDWPDNGIYQLFEITYSPKTNYGIHSSLIRQFMSILKERPNIQTMASYKTIFGNLNKYFVIAHYEDPDQALHPELPQLVQKCISGAEVTTKLMTPWPWSKWMK